jgi:hypothetical protein
MNTEEHGSKPELPQRVAKIGESDAHVRAPIGAREIAAEATDASRFLWPIVSGIRVNPCSSVVTRFVDWFTELKPHTV